MPGTFRYFDFSSSLYFALLGSFSFTLFSIVNILLLMLKTLLHYYKNKK